MVCAVKSDTGNSLKVGLASMKPDMHGLIETAPTSKSKLVPPRIQLIIYEELITAVFSPKTSVNIQQELGHWIFRVHYWIFR